MRRLRHPGNSQQRRRSRQMPTSEYDFGKQFTGKETPAKSSEAKLTEYSGPKGRKPQNLFDPVVL